MKSIKINILTDRNFVSFFFFFPLLVNKERLNDLGVKIKFYEEQKDELWDADVVFLDSKVMGWVRPIEDLLEIIESRRNPGRIIIWLDSSASTGTTHFEVLPVVDAYWKKQYLRDLSLYSEPMSGARLFTDYYERQMGSQVENVYLQHPLDMELAHKLQLSWNLGVGAYGIHNRVSNLLRLIPWWIKEYVHFSYRDTSREVGVERSMPLVFRGSNSYSNSALAYQRVKTIEFMKVRGITTESLSYTDYWRELKQAMIALSPFGFGEICYRDFEIFLAGAALAKPSMEHLSTYPDFFKVDTTYISFAWDFSDLDQRIDTFLSRPEKLLAIASKGQELLLDFRSREGQEAFCSRLVDMLELAR